MSARPGTTAERLLPGPDHRETHERLIAGPPAAVWEALHAVTVRELPLFSMLMSLRTGAGRRAVGEAADRTALDACAPSPLVVDAPHELVLGDIARYHALRPAHPPVTKGDAEEFAAFSESGWTKVVMDFRLLPEQDGAATRLVTDTLVRSTDPFTRRLFRLYWIPVQVGSGLIRRDILRGIAGRLERATTDRPVTGTQL